MPATAQKHLRPEERHIGQKKTPTAKQNKSTCGQGETEQRTTPEKLKALAGTKIDIDPYRFILIFVLGGGIDTCEAPFLKD